MVKPDFMTLAKHPRGTREKTVRVLHPDRHSLEAMELPSVDLKAGKMVLEGRMMKPDVRKGLVRVHMAEDMTVHLQWHTRNDTGAAVHMETDTIIFPDEATFSKIERPGARIFHLKFATEPDRDMFFWSQEPDEASDGRLAHSINAAINGAFADDVDMTEDGTDPNTEQDAAIATLMELPGTAAVGAGSAAGPVTSAQLAQILGGIGAASGIGAAGASSAAALQPTGNTSKDAAIAAAMLAQLAGAAQQQQRRVALGPSLADVLKTETLLPLLDDDDLVAQVVQYLPQQHRTPHAVRQVVASPQFRHQLQLLSVALQTGQLDYSQFGLPPAAGFTVKDFLMAIQQSVEKSQRKEPR